MLFGTDSGPACEACHGTIYAYTLETGLRVEAKCSTCHKEAGFRLPRNLCGDMSAQRIREVHERVSAIRWLTSLRQWRGVCNRQIQSVGYERIGNDCTASDALSTLKNAIEDVIARAERTVRLTTEGQAWLRERELERMSKDFMKPTVYQADVYEVDTVNGTEYVERSVIGAGPHAPNSVQPYVESRIEPDMNDEWLTLRERAWCAYLSAPGYMDRTELAVFDTQAEAEQYLIDTYGDEVRS